MFLPDLCTIDSPHSALTISPHPDDDILAVGGILAGNIRAGGEVMSVVITDGVKGTADASFDQQLAGIRREETLRASRVLGFSNIHFWDEPDGDFKAVMDKCNKLAGIIRDVSPDFIYTPFPVDYHWDHLEAAKMTVKALNLLHSDIPLRCYECIIPLIPNKLFDITSVIEKKRDAVRCFKTQNEVTDYEYTIIEGLNRHRTHGQMAGKGYAEAIFETDRVFLQDLIDELMNH